MTTRKARRRPARDAAPAAHPVRPPAFARRLVAWFDEVARDLPWRRRRDDYAVFVSEIMLQQTTVAAVAPRFERFVARFPGWSDLARAPVDDVLAEWSGLGYYRRARNLHAAAEAVVRDHDGRFPRDAEGARRLPGVGHYTAGAVLSLAWGLAEPAVDGNVARVFSRWLGRSLDPSRAADRRELEEVVRRLMPEDSPGRFNEALMELGATTCTPRAPACATCPVAADCVARRDGLQGSLPTSKSARTVEVTAVGAWIERGDAVLLVRRADDSPLLAGLWELPGTWCEDDETPANALARVLADLGGGRVGEPVALVPHAITHRRIRLHVHACTLVRRPRRTTRLGWFSPTQARELALTTATRRALERLGSPPGPA